MSDETPSLSETGSSTPSRPYHPLAECVDALEWLIRSVAETPYTVGAFLDELPQYKVELPQDPEEEAVKFNTSYAQVQAFQTRVSEILFEMRRVKRQWQYFFREAKTLHRKAKQLMISSNYKDVRSLRNKEMQEAMLDQELRELVDVREIIEGRLEDIDSCIDMVQIVFNNLENANTNLSRQQRVVETLLHLNYPVRARRGNT